jgi:hypothetical protein
MNTAISTHEQFLDSVSALLVGRASASPRPFLVRWTDEDRGNRQMVVIAADEFHARQIIEQVTDQVVTQVLSL